MNNQNNNQLFIVNCILDIAKSRNNYVDNKSVALATKFSEYSIGSSQLKHKESYYSTKIHMLRKKLMFYPLKRTPNLLLALSLAYLRRAQFMLDNYTEKENKNDNSPALTDINSALNILFDLSKQRHEKLFLTHFLIGYSFNLKHSYPTYCTDCDSSDIAIDIFSILKNKFPYACVLEQLALAHKNIADIQNYLADIPIDTENYKTARDILLILLTQYEVSLHKQSCWKKLLLDVCKVHAETASPQEAISSCEIFIDLYKSFPTIEQETNQVCQYSEFDLADVYCEKGYCLRQAKQHDTAMLAYKNCLDIYKTQYDTLINNKNTYRLQKLTEIYHTMSILCKKRGDMKIASTYMQKYNEIRAICTAFSENIFDFDFS